MRSTTGHGRLTGLHHVTAVTGDARANVAFYTQTLGMRLVKRTVNQDDPSAYHLFYADAEGTPGTDLTFFDWPNTPPRQHGPGTIAGTGLRVSGRSALEWWAARLGGAQVTHDVIAERNGRASLRFRDPEGQTITLVDDGGTSGGQPWKDSPVPIEHSVRGLGPVVLAEYELAPTARFLTEVLGFQESGRYSDVVGHGEHGAHEAEVVIYSTGEGGAGAEVHVAAVPGMPRGSVGRGGVHHVAFRTPDDEQHVAWQQYLSESGVRVTPVIDRFYFRSLYFREPGGVLFEIATDGPGFAVDEPKDRLGEGLALPPFLEPHRKEIESNLVPL